MRVQWSLLEGENVGPQGPAPEGWGSARHTPPPVSWGNPGPGPGHFPGRTSLLAEAEGESRLPGARSTLSHAVTTEAGGIGARLCSALIYHHLQLPEFFRRVGGAGGRQPEGKGPIALVEHRLGVEIRPWLWHSLAT